MLKLVLSAFTHTLKNNAPVKLRGRYQMNFIMELTIIMLKKIGLIFSSFKPFPFLPSAATDDRKQFQCRNMAILFLGFN